MGNAATKGYQDLLGFDALDAGNNLSRKGKGDSVDFLVPSSKQLNYLKYCDLIEISHDPIGIINQYTDHTTKYFGKVNLALASDSPLLESYGPYIRQLRSSILTMPLYDEGNLYRGCDFSDVEIAQMEKMGSFFIPSFTSTSVNLSMAYNKSCLIVVKTPYSCRNACSITPGLSKFYSSEKEVLLSCYSAFRLEKIEKVNNQKIISIFLDEHLSSMDQIFKMESGI